MDKEILKNINKAKLQSAKFNEALDNFDKDLSNPHKATYSVLYVGRGIAFEQELIERIIRQKDFRFINTNDDEKLIKQIDKSIIVIKNNSEEKEK